MRLTNRSTGIPIIGSWTANDGAFYAENDISSSDQVIASITKYIKNISQKSLQKLLDLYPLDSFNFLVRPNQVNTPQYYQAAQINRDLWFTCPVIDFTWQYARFGNNAPVRLYEMNQTRFDPIFANIGHPEWRVAHLSDLPYFFNEPLVGGGDNTAAQFALSRVVAGSIAAFAYTGDPTSAPPGKEVLRDWPLAYPGAGPRSGEFPQNYNVKVIGGPLGEGATDAADAAGAAMKLVAYKRRALGARAGGRVEENGVEKRDDQVGATLDQALAWERVIERCNFIDSISKEIGV